VVKSKELKLWQKTYKTRNDYEIARLRFMITLNMKAIIKSNGTELIAILESQVKRLEGRINDIVARGNR
jgi:hypothetical protein